MSEMTSAQPEACSGRCELAIPLAQDRVEYALCNPQSVHRQVRIPQFQYPKNHTISASKFTASKISHSQRHLRRVPTLPQSQTLSIYRCACTDSAYRLGWQPHPARAGPPGSHWPRGPRAPPPPRRPRHAPGAPPPAATAPPWSTPPPATAPCSCRPRLWPHHERGYARGSFVFPLVTRQQRDILSGGIKKDCP